MGAFFYKIRETGHVFFCRILKMYFTVANIVSCVSVTDAQQALFPYQVHMEGGSHFGCRFCPYLVICFAPWTGWDQPCSSWDAGRILQTPGLGVCLLVALMSVGDCNLRQRMRLQDESGPGFSRFWLRWWCSPLDGTAAMLQAIRGPVLLWAGGGQLLRSFLLYSFWFFLKHLNTSSFIYLHIPVVCLKPIKKSLFVFTEWGVQDKMSHAGVKSENRKQIRSQKWIRAWAWPEHEQCSVTSCCVSPTVQRMKMVPDSIPSSLARPDLISSVTINWSDLSNPSPNHYPNLRRIWSLQ